MEMEYTSKILYHTDDSGGSSNDYPINPKPLPLKNFAPDISHQIAREQELAEDIRNPPESNRLWR